MKLANNKLKLVRSTFSHVGFKNLTGKEFNRLRFAAKDFFILLTNLQTIKH